MKNKVWPRPIPTINCSLGKPRRGIRRGNGVNFFVEGSAPPTHLLVADSSPSQSGRGILRSYNNPANEILDREFKEMLSKVDCRKIRNKKILVTGANGFLGQYIVGALSLANREMKLNATIDTVGLTDPKTVLTYILSRDKNISYRKIDLTKDFHLGEYDYIFHAAGYGQPARFINDPYSTITISTFATHRLLEDSPKATFIFFSSGEIYGDTPTNFTPTNENYNGNCPLHLPRSVYAESKRLGEALCATYARDLGADIKIVRISLSYGPGLPSNDTRVMSDFIRKALKDKEIKLLDAGKTIKTYGYAPDTASMILFTALHGKEMVYNVGGINAITILGLAKKIAKNCSVKYTLPSNTSRLSHIGKDPVIIKLDLTKIKREMGKFKFMSFSEGLSRTIEWQKLLYEIDDRK